MRRYQRGSIQLVEDSHTKLTYGSNYLQSLNDLLLGR